MFKGVDILWIGSNILVLLFSVSLHESAHAWIAGKRGDPTGKLLGRVSLNPLRHLDPVGSLLVPMIGIFTGAPVFGWAKPVPVNPANLPDFRRDQLFISLAGPLSNLCAAASFFLVIKLLAVPAASIGGFPGVVLGVTVMICQIGFLINIILAVFNLIPIPPLDGSWVLAGLLPARYLSYFERIRPYGFFILLLLLVTGGIGFILGPILDSAIALIR